jgi:hypothetical protein
MDIPSVSMSRISDTQMRCPLMHGLPKQTSGFMEILSRWFCFIFSNLGSGSGKAFDSESSGVKNQPPSGAARGTRIDGAEFPFKKRPGGQPCRAPPSMSCNGLNPHHPNYSLTLQ